MTDDELLTLIEKLRSTMIAVATGGPRISDVNDEFQKDHRFLTSELAARGLDNPSPYGDLWQWYGKWSADIPGYAPRRAFVANLFSPLIARIQLKGSVEIEATGWARVDRTIREATHRLPHARNEEQFQTIGLLCREALISLAQEVFDATRHPTEPGVQVSPTDFKRMIQAYIAVEMSGSAAEEIRKHARTALDLALRLQHQRTAGFRDAAICVEATSSVINIIAIGSGRRDPTG
jgi:hypothetical protein